MFRKKIIYIYFAIAAAALFLAGCGAPSSDGAGAETGAVMMEKAVTEENKESKSEAMAAEETGMEEAGPGEDAETERKEDGPEKKIEAFAETVQEAVSDRDLEALGDLLFYPCVFITGDEETVILEKKEDLLKQNPDMVFGDDLMVSVANVDTATLKADGEGVVLGEGTSGITFQEKTGFGLRITEIRE
ncbi:MAG: hypothetical protein QM657_00705 [Lacrimispora sp.]|uniref:hypothetical protein n=1 Tax=Lacrimispora sp. TaxID=2719234 RepID=UPI0039E2CE80